MPAFFPTGHGVDLFRGCRAQDRSRGAGCGNQNGRLLFNNVEIVIPRHVDIPAFGQLENFAFRHDISHPGDQFKNIVVADFAHQHKGLETQKIAHQNTDGISEYFIGGRFAASDQG
jgi:hypothetical protein